MATVDPDLDPHFDPREGGAGLGPTSNFPSEAHEEPVSLPSGRSGMVAKDRTILEVEVVPELCMCFLNCMRIATGAFQRDRATGRTRPARWQQVDPAKLWRAAWSCPTGAIRFVTDEGYVNPRWEEAAHWRKDLHPAAGRRRATGAPSEAGRREPTEQPE